MQGRDSDLVLDNVLGGILVPVLKVRLDISGLDDEAGAGFGVLSVCSATAAAPPAQAGAVGAAAAHSIHARRRRIWGREKRV